VAVCNLASIALPAFVRDGAYDFQKLREVTHVVTRNLNKIIDVKCVCSFAGLADCSATTPSRRRASPTCATGRSASVSRALLTPSWPSDW